MKEEELSGFFANRVKTPSYAAGEARTELEQYKRQEPGVIVRFGFKDLDQEMVMVRGGTYLVAGRPGGGKTAFMKQVCGNVAATLPEERAIVILSAEMSAANLLHREACGREKLSYFKMIQGQLSEEEYARLDSRLQEMGKGRIYIDDTPAPTLEHMIDTLMEVEQVAGQVGFVAFDYLGLAGELDTGSEVRRIHKVSKGLAGIARRFNCPVLVLHQSNRGQEKADDIMMSHLMSGGEQEASGIIILDTPEDTLNCMNLHIVKNRHGPSGKMVSLYWNKEQMRFNNMAGVGRNHLDTGTMELLPPPHVQYNVYDD